MDAEAPDHCLGTPDPRRWVRLERRTVARRQHRVGRVALTQGFASMIVHVAIIT
jgi:hypothetical protein